MKKYKYEAAKNQRHVSINKTACDRENLYATINIKALNKAREMLKPTALNMWLYFVQNQDGHNFYLSCVHCCNMCNISSTAYHNGFHELMDKGYLQDIDGNNCNFIFHDFPQE
jgi:hypothetical protein